MKLWRPGATVNTTSHSTVQVKNNARRDVTRDVRKPGRVKPSWYKRLLASEEIFIPHLTRTWWRDNQQYAVISKETWSVASAFFMGKVSLPQILTVQRCLSETIRKHPMQDDTSLLDFPQWGVGTRGQGDKWQECWSGSGLGSHPCLGAKAGLPLSDLLSFDSMIYLNICPSDAKDEMTPYKEVISYLNPIYLQTLFQHLPN